MTTEQKPTKPKTKKPTTTKTLTPTTTPTPAPTKPNTNGNHKTKKPTLTRCSNSNTQTTNGINGPKPTTKPTTSKKSTKKESTTKEKMEVDDGSVVANGINGTKGTNGTKSEEKEEKDDDGLVLYQFPMNRVSRIIKSEDPNFRVAQEAVYVINKASEKFLQVFTTEAYANAFLDHKKHIDYKHLSSVVSKRKRFDFLSDFVPEKIKAEDALKDPQPVEN